MEKHLFSLTTMDTTGCTTDTIRNTEFHTEFYTEKKQHKFLCVNLCALRVKKRSNAIVSIVKTIVPIVVKHNPPFP